MHSLLAPPLTRVKLSAKKDAITRIDFMTTLEICGGEVADGKRGEYWGPGLCL
jgi:hypothetical protein